MLKKISLVVGSAMAFLFAVVSSASAQISTSSLDTIVDTATTDAWNYITTVLTSILPFAVGVIVLGGAIYFVLRHLRIVR